MRSAVVCWAGFSDGKLDFIDVDAGWGGFGRGETFRVVMPAIFKTRQAARERYEDVRRVVITEEAPS